MKRMLNLAVGFSLLLASCQLVAASKNKKARTAAAVPSAANVPTPAVTNASAVATAPAKSPNQPVPANTKSAATAKSALTDDTVLLAMDHKPVLTVKDFTSFVNEIAQSDQQIFWMLQVDPARVQANLYEAKVRALLIGEWAQKDGIRNTPEYKAEEQELLERIRMMLDNQAFIRAHQVEVTEADLQKYYDEHKATDPSLLLAPAGVEAKAVRFSKAAAKAEEFAARLRKDAKFDIEQLAKQSELEAHPLGVINEKSYSVMPEIQTAVLAVQQFPAVLVVPCEEDHWVVLATGKVAAKYQPLEQVKGLLKEALYPEKVKAMLDAEMPKLMQRFKAVENKQYFADLQAAAAAEAAVDEAAAILECEDVELAPANGAEELLDGDLELDLLDSNDTQN